VFRNFTHPQNTGKNCRANDAAENPLALEEEVAHQARVVEQARKRWRVELDRLNALEAQLLTRPGWTRAHLVGIYSEHALL
jgi:hypothetical protein